MNIKNINEVMNLIKAHPEIHDQTKWHCNTCHCIAGVANLIAGNFPLNHEFKILITFGCDEGEHLKFEKGMPVKLKDVYEGINARIWAAEWLELTDTQANILFAPENSLTYMLIIVEEWIKEQKENSK